MNCIHLNTSVTRLFYFPELKNLHLILKKNIVYSSENVEADFETIHELKKEEHLFVLIDMGDASFEHIPKEVMHFMANSPYRKYQKKIALITPGTGTKLFGNFYINVFKPEKSTRIFNNLSDALKWFELKNENSLKLEIEQALQHNH
jgi:hypothetical protein